MLHIEKPPARRTLSQSCYNFQEIEASLKRKLKPIDVHPKVVAKDNLKGLPWVVTEILITMSTVPPINKNQHWSDRATHPAMAHSKPF